MYALRFYVSALLVAAASAGTIKERQNLGSLLGGLLGGGGADGADGADAAGGAAAGGLGCNLARLRIVGALGDTEDSVSQIADAATQADAAAGLEQAQGGIQQIAQAILAGEAPPQEGREEVEAGLGAAGAALAAGDADDQAIIDAQESLDEAVAAGQDVVASC